MGEVVWPSWPSWLALVTFAKNKIGKIVKVASKGCDTWGKTTMQVEIKNRRCKSEMSFTRIESVKIVG